MTIQYTSEPYRVTTHATKFVTAEKVEVLVVISKIFPTLTPTEETLRERIIENVFSLSTKYVNPFFVILDDLNTFFLIVKALLIVIVAPTQLKGTQIP